MAVQYSNFAMAKEDLQQIAHQFRRSIEVNSDLATAALVVLVTTQIFAFLFFSLGVALHVGELLIGACILSTVGILGSALGYLFLKDPFMRGAYNNQHLLALERHIERLPIENPET